MELRCRADLVRLVLSEAHGLAVSCVRSSSIGCHGQVARLLGSNVGRRDRLGRSRDSAVGAIATDGRCRPSLDDAPKSVEPALAGKPFRASPSIPGCSSTAPATRSSAECLQSELLCGGRRGHQQRTACVPVNQGCNSTDAECCAGVARGTDPLGGGFVAPTDDFPGRSMTAGARAVRRQRARAQRVEREDLAARMTVPIAWRQSRETRVIDVCREKARRRGERQRGT